MIDPAKAFKDSMRRVNKIRRKLAKEKVGLPKKVVFIYQKGKVTAYPQERKWIAEANGKKHTHMVNGRNDVTKFKAKMYLKYLLSGIWKHDSV